MEKGREVAISYTISEDVAGEPRTTDLESVLGASPREFESRILRHADQA